MKRLAQIAQEAFEHEMYGNGGGTPWVLLDQITRDAWESAIDEVLIEIKNRVEDEVEE
jgi:hypothetical protein